MISFLLQILALLFFIYLISQYNIKLLSRLIYTYKPTKTVVLKLLALLFLVGTFIHEMGHLLIAELLMVRTDDLNLIPEIKDKSNFKLGGVKIQATDPVRRTIIGLAPVLLGLIIIWVASGLWTSLASYSWYKILYVFLLFQVGHTMFSSRQDLQGALIGLFIIVLLFVLGYLLNQIIVLDLFIQVREAISQFLQDGLPTLIRGLVNTLIIILVFTTILLVLGLFKRNSSLKGQ